MGINTHERFENHMDVSSPETIGDAERKEDADSNDNGDEFEKRMSLCGFRKTKGDWSFNTPATLNERKSHLSDNEKNPSDLSKEKRPESEDKKAYSNVIPKDEVDTDIYETDINFESSSEWKMEKVKVIDCKGQSTEVEMEPSALRKKYSEAIDNGDNDTAEKYRALYEINSIKDDLQLSDGDTNIKQLGGYYKDVKAKAKGYQSHHIPAKSIQSGNEKNMPTIALLEEDHKLTDSYGGKQKTHLADSFLSDKTVADPRYKKVTEDLIDSGNYTDLVRSELYNVRDVCGQKYDGAIKQYLNTLAEMIAQNGVPTPKGKTGNEKNS